MRTLMSGGGTAGHIYPALTVAEQLAADAGPDEVLFVGTPEGLEARLVTEAGIRFFALPASGYNRSRPWTLLTSTLKILVSTVRAWRLIRRERPDVVAGFGGYVSLPVGLGARLSGTPLVLHEQNSVPGLANRVLSRWATRVAVTYETSIPRLAHPSRALLTGNPVRSAVLTADRARGRSALGVTESETLLLVFGGSRGARHINSAVVAILPRLLQTPHLKVVHVAGRDEADSVRNAATAAGVGEDRYSVMGYVQDMGSMIAAADLVVARAGATSIAEITALGRPAVLVPYPYATDDHQTANARALVDAGGALLVADGDLDGELFYGAVTGLVEDPERRATMAAASRAMGHPEASVEVVRLLRSAAARGVDPSRESNR